MFIFYLLYTSELHICLFSYILKQNYIIYYNNYNIFIIPIGDTFVKIFIGIAVLFGISVFTCSFVWYRFVFI